METVCSTVSPTSLISRGQYRDASDEMRCVQLCQPSPTSRRTGCPRKNATDLNNCNGSCFILVNKQLFLLKSTIIRINFDIFSSIFGDLVVNLIISKVQNCFQVETRAAALAIAD